MKNVPENCRLTAHWSGDGWALCVEDDKYEVVAYLKWPENWPSKIDDKTLQKFGFEVV